MMVAQIVFLFPSHAIQQTWNLQTVNVILENNQPSTMTHYSCRPYKWRQNTQNFAVGPFHFISEVNKGIDHGKLLSICYMTSC